MPAVTYSAELGCLCDHDQFDVQERIGDGAFGEVFTAVHEKTGKLVALKRIRDEKAGEWERIRNEECIHRKLVFPSIPKYYCTYLSPNDSVIMVVEYIHGLSMYDVIYPDDQSLEAEEKTRDLIEGGLFKWTAQTAVTLDYLSRNGIVYGDLKLENAVLAPSGNLFFIDFGLAKDLYGPPDPLGGIQGSEPYMSPEHLLTSGRARTFACDLFAAGVMFYELVYRRAPIEYPPRESADSSWRHPVIALLRNPGVVCPRRTQPVLENLIEQLCRYDPRTRSEVCMASVKLHTPSASSAEPSDLDDFHGPDGSHLASIDGETEAQPEKFNSDELLKIRPVSSEEQAVPLIKLKGVSVPPKPSPETVRAGPPGEAVGKGDWRSGELAAGGAQTFATELDWTLSQLDYSTCMYEEDVLLKHPWFAGTRREDVLATYKV